MVESQLAIPLKDLLQRIDRLKGEIDTLRPLSLEQEGRIMQKFRLDWNYHSNAIEGNSLTYGETIAFLMEGLTAKGKPFKDHQDIKGHNEGIDYLMNLIKNHEQLSEKTIRELHKMVLVEPYSTPAQTPDGQKVDKRVALGAYKTMPNHVKTPTGEIHYYATPEETPAKMTDLVAWLRDHQTKKDLHPLLLAATFHYRFVAIHPFDDGNGRMSRLLMNLLLMQYGYPPVIVKQQDRQAYYFALRQADGGELSAFIEYMGENLLHSLNIQLKGAKGESLEEPDDLDKEIALLKGSLEGEEMVPKSEDEVRTLLLVSVIPLLDEIKRQCIKLDDMFLRSWDRVQYARDAEVSLTTIEGPIQWSMVKSNLLETGDKMMFRISYDYFWNDFRKTKDPFNIHQSINIQFMKFKYEIDFKTVGLPVISKTYSQKLSSEEISELSKIFVREALAQIKAHTGK